MPEQWHELQERWHRLPACGAPLPSRQRPGFTDWRPLLWLIAIAFALLFGGFLLWDQQAQRGSLEAECSTYRTDAIGCKALYLTLGALDYRTEQLQTDYAA